MTDQQATQLQRAISIAKQYGHKVHTATVRATGETCYTVKSHSDPLLHHVLTIQDGRIMCDCYAAQVKQIICSHAAAVRLFLIAQRDALAAIEQYEASCSKVEAMMAEYQEQESSKEAAPVLATEESELAKALREQQEAGAAYAQKQAAFWQSWVSLECQQGKHQQCLPGCPCTCTCHQHASASKREQALLDTEGGYNGSIFKCSR